MLFNSLEFALFLPFVFIIYWYFVNKNLKVQNFFLLVVSYFFYGWWDWRFLSLIFFSSVVDYILGIQIDKNKNIVKRKVFLSISIFVNLSFLAFFKYYNFFVESFVDAFLLFGRPLNPTTLKIILPVGISFYTFQTLSYSIDIFRGKLKPTTDIIAFFAFVSFFPQLVAGPIERARNLLPQFNVKRIFDYNKAVDGMQQILWGLFKKIVIADNCAGFVNDVFANYANEPTLSLILGFVLFTIQIYCDFSGYSDIAIGTSRLFGFNLMKNFNFPLFSRNIGELWRNWHISLTTWFRDYVYVPIGGSKGGTGAKIRNIFIIFIVSGFWHGANLTFVVWGLLSALYFLPEMLLGKNRNFTGTIAKGRILPSFKEGGQMLLTFMFFAFSFVVFRSPTITDSWLYIVSIFSNTFFEMPDISIKLMFFIFIMFAVEWLQRDKEHGLQISHIKSIALKRVIYYVIVFFIISFSGSQQDFIYFQF